MISDTDYRDAIRGIVDAAEDAISTLVDLVGDCNRPHVEDAYREYVNNKVGTRAVLARRVTRLVDDIEPLMIQHGRVSLNTETDWEAFGRIVRDAAAYRAL